MSAETPENAKATRREWIGLAALVLPCLLYSMDLTVLNLAVPAITADLKPTSTQLLWIIDIYGFLLAGFLITMGTLGDRIGRRRVLLIGATAFGAASTVAAFSTSAEMLIVARALLGIAAATLAPSTLALIRNMFLDPRERTFAIGIWVAGFSAGAAMGPVLGGVMLSYFSWGAVFLLNVPIMLMVLIVGPLLLPEFKDPKPGNVDIASALLSLIAVLSAIWGVKHIAADGVGWISVVAIAAGVFMGFLFYRRQTKLADPLIDVALLRRPEFAATLTVNILVLFTAFGSFLFLAQYLQLVLGMTAMEAGLWTAPTGTIFVVGSMAAPILVRHLRPSSVIAGGLVLAAIGFAILTQVRDNDSLGLLMAGMLIFCLGLAPIGALTTDMILSLAPPERAGAASALSETSFEFGGALGIAVLGSVMTATYRGLMTDAVPINIPSAAAAIETLGAAVEVARQLPAEAAADLLASAKSAFTAGFGVAAWACVATTLAALAITLTVLRRADAETAVNAGRDDSREPVAIECRQIP